MSDQKPDQELDDAVETTQDSSDISSKLGDAQKAFMALKASLDEEASTLMKERESFEHMRRKLDVHFKKHIKLNVGGQIFKTSIETLGKDPDSMLASMFSGRFEVKPDEDGAYFIDRDGTNFRIILNYLRTGELIYPKENKILTKELYLEAKFYQVVNIQKEIWPELAFENSNYIIGSLNEEQKAALLSWLPEKQNFLTWVQLYSSTSHGWLSSSVHQRCDNSGPIIVVARAGNNIFGGYAEASWSSDGQFVQDANAFLFTLANANAAPPTKLPIPPGGNSGIWCTSAYGPGFGSSSSYNIYFKNGNNTATCLINNGNCGFVVPGSQALSTFIYGNASVFNLNYLEVFGLKQ